MLQNSSSLSRVMEQETISKNGASSKSQMSRRNSLRKTYFVLLTIFLFIASCSNAVKAQVEISSEEFRTRNQAIDNYLGECLEKKDYKAGEKILQEAITLFNQLSEKNQETHKRYQAVNYFNLTCVYSLQNQKKKALDTFEKAVYEYEWYDYSHALIDTDLDNIRTDERFISIMQFIRGKADFIYILRQAGKYQSPDVKELPSFTYEASTSWNLKEVKNFFNLDAIAGKGDEISKIINLLKWAHDNIRHDGSNYALCEFDAIDIYNYHKSTGKGVNCRHLAIALNEMYLAMGFKSRFVTCIAKDETDAHVINSVYSTTLKKWLWIDPTMNAYWRDENGNLLSIEEVRERLIVNHTLVLNEDANWNNQNKQTKEGYLDNWMSKYLYWFSCPANFCFNPESRYRDTNQTYINLCPLGYEPSSLNAKRVITHDATYFWEH